MGKLVREWISVPDGKRFASKEACDEHEAVTAFTDWLVNSDDAQSGVSAENAAAVVSRIKADPEGFATYAKVFFPKVERKKSGKRGKKSNAPLDTTLAAE